MGRATGGQVAARRARAGREPGRRGQYDAAPPPIAGTPPPPSGPWGRSRIPQTEPTEPSSKPQPRLREAQPPMASPLPRTPVGSRTNFIGDAIAKSVARTATTIAVREGTKILFGSGKNPGLLRGVLGSIFKG